MKKIYLFLILSLLIIKVGFCQEVIPDFTDKSVTVVNDELKKIRDKSDRSDTDIAALGARITTLETTKIRQQAVGVTSGPTTASTSYVDLTDMSITATTGANPVLVLFTGVFSNDTSGSRVWVVIDIDGSAYAEITFIPVAGNYIPMSTSYLRTMTSGSHTFKIRWKVDANTGTAYTTLRQMQVIEL